MKTSFHSGCGWTVRSLILFIWASGACASMHGAESSADSERPRTGPRQGYYRFPAIHGKQIVFTAEGDLWRVGVSGGVAQRLTTHPGDETHPSFSPDGRTLAFSAEYEGPTEVYTMPAEGGLPTRRTFEGGGTETVGWTPDGKVLYSTWRHWSLPDEQLATLDLDTGTPELLPLSQASHGVFDDSGQTLFFTRLPFNRGSVKRYKGGTAENLWKFKGGEGEAVPLTADYPGTSRSPLWWAGRVYFVTDRDGTMNLWSLTPDGRDLRQHTKHKGWDVKWPALSQGRIVYQLGADLRLYDIGADKDEVTPISLASDFDHEREKWVKKPLDYVTSASLSSNGDRVARCSSLLLAPAGSSRRRGNRVCATAMPALCRMGNRCSRFPMRVAKSNSSASRPTASASRSP